MSGKKISSAVKMGLELGPIVAFFIGYSFWKDEVFTIAGAEYGGFIVVTALFIPVMVASTLLLWRLTGVLSKMQVVTLVLVVVFGGLTVWLNDEAFFKMKPTIIYALFAAALGIGLLRGQSYLSLVMGEALPMAREGWMILTRRLMLFFAALAFANEAVWRLMSTDAWVNFKTFALPVALFAFFMSQGGLLARHSLAEPKDD